MHVLVNFLSIFNHPKNVDLVKTLKAKFDSLKVNVDFLVHTHSSKMFENLDSSFVKCIEYKSLDIKKALKNGMFHINRVELDQEKIYSLVLNVNDASTRGLYELIDLTTFDLSRLLSIASQEYKMLLILTNDIKKESFDKVTDLNFLCSSGIFRILVSSLRTLKPTDKSEIAFCFSAYRLNLPVIKR